MKRRLARDPQAFDAERLDAIGSTFPTRHRTTSATSAQPVGPACSARRSPVRRVGRRQLEHIRGHPSPTPCSRARSALGDFSLIWHLANAGRGLTSDRGPRQVPVLAARSASRASRQPGPQAAVPATPPDGHRRSALRVRKPLTSAFPSGHASAAAFTAMMLTGWDGRRSARSGGRIGAHRGDQPGLCAHPPRLRRRRRHGDRCRPRPRRALGSSRRVGIR